MQRFEHEVDQETKSVFHAIQKKEVLGQVVFRPLRLLMGSAT